MITAAAVASVRHALPPSHHSPTQACEDGWLGQVPPPEAPRVEPTPEPQPHAVPWLAPEPWKSEPVLPGTDPTLFG